MNPPTASDAAPALTERITAYLSGGGLFNPELANHDAVRDLLIDCRAALSAASTPVAAEPSDYPPLPDMEFIGTSRFGSIFRGFTEEQMHTYVDADRASRAAPPVPPAEASEPVTRAQIKAIFLRNGFAVKPGEVDLKECLYKAGEQLVKFAQDVRPTGPLPAPVSSQPTGWQPTRGQYENLLDDIADWGRHVEVDTAPKTLDQHVRDVFAEHGIASIVGKDAP
ncbi:hypothetical protein RD110_10805 [Rhodoferax koreense]|uniref:Uncharacterized protein n=1 Tax=Rhodoferax koreensis TaxID=1842727 RepID=A0A1P8JV15_9BURK|nr:hypothetical protein [Rhodoferax koreense]APW37616.1 hypothetical protein RD110_10805 [Rhodoferax koreense]